MTRRRFETAPGSTPRLPLALVLVALAAATPPLVAQQREPKIEVYGLSGIYATEVNGGLFKPEVGAGVLLPLGSKWAALVDASVGVPRLNEYQWKPGEPYTVEAEFYRRNPHLTNEDVHWRRVTTIRPSIVRIWRRARVSIYAGAGFGLESEHYRRRNRRILVVHDKDGNPVWERENDILPALVQAESFTTGEGWSHQKALIGRFGVLASLTPRIGVRGGYSCLVSYLEQPLSGAIEVGIGYRFD